MGAAIGIGRQFSEPDLNSYVRPEVKGLASDRDTRGLDYKRTKNTPGDILFSKKPAEDLRVGFGKNTITPPAVAVRAVKKNVQEARQLVPSLEELMQEARTTERSRGQNERDNRQTPEARPADIAFQRKNIETTARTRAQDFVNRLDETAATAEARLRGEEPSSKNRTDIKVGDDFIPVYRDNPKPTFDVRI
ncbi:MAG TPA: hypothetical protein PKY35_00475 [Candidatus Hydrogenedentes bacterium]|nr:hypothetical protein [Candidatus Hydrogenedentota bacterium]HOL75477.1 hypothetical protein [Candidatus Hydrogenedentota bacterium]HPO86081.1 hypothetical protein [Candidatus Hydrogenedentota bacterium]